MSTWLIADSIQRGGKRVCEDRIGVAGSLAWVIDGATPLTDEPLTEAESDAAWLADRLDLHLRRVPAEVVAHRSLSAVLERVLQQVSTDARRVWSHRPSLPPSAALALVKNDGTQVEYLVLADVTMHASPLGPSVCDDRVEASTNSAMELLVEELAHLRRHEDAMAVVRPALVASRQTFMNTPGGYWVASVDPSASRQGLQGSFAVTDTTRVLLCTDGFSRAWDTFGLLTDAEAALTSGLTLAEILHQIRDVEHQDAQCRKHPRWSVHDDAAALVLVPCQASQSTTN